MIRYFINKRKRQMLTRYPELVNMAIYSCDICGDPAYYSNKSLVHLIGYNKDHSAIHTHKRETNEN